MFSKAEAAVAWPLNTVALDNPAAVKEVEYNSSGETGWAIRLFKPTGAALVKGAVVKIAYSGQASGDPQVATVTSGAAAFDRVVVAAEAVSSGTFGWFFFAGVCDAMVDGTTDVTLGDYLKMVAGTDNDAFIKDGTALTINSCAVAMAAQASDANVLTKVRLLGERVTIG